MPALPRRPLGRSGLSVAPFALGGNVFGWTVDEAMGFRILDAFVTAGFNLIDTADTYSRWVPGHVGGESERIIGRWLRESGRRSEVLIATKVGMDMGPGGQGLSAGHIARSIEGSLERLQVEAIDLYQAHVDDPTTPLEETLGAFAALVDSGRVRAIGASNYTADRLEAALRLSADRGFPRFESLQPRYNLLDRPDFEGVLEGVCSSHGLGVIPYSSLAAGFLTGKYRSAADLGKSPRGARAGARLNERGHRVLAALDEISTRLDAAPATIALAWLIARPSVTAPIASATSLPQLEELERAASLHLDADALGLLERASAPTPG
jgi:aryl-alcohol dehydrogenase-like predicted oxidoreductase